jgi:hypothetical protein
MKVSSSSLVSPTTAPCESTIDGSNAFKTEHPPVPR